MKNLDVARAWKEGRSATGSHFWTDGRELLSYNLRVGVTLDDGRKVALDFTARSGNRVSPTTSTHVGLASLVADLVAPPQRVTTRGRARIGQRVVFELLPETQEEGGSP